jgi:tetratricopeptide (TPR) repeat protein
MVPAYKNLGAALIAISRIEEGIDAYRHALNLDPAVLESPPDFPVILRGEEAMVQYYYLAKLCAVNGRIDSAIEYLNKAKVAGFANFKKITLDPDFKDIINDSRFVEMAQSNMK